MFLILSLIITQFTQGKLGQLWMRCPLIMIEGEDDIGIR